MSNVNILISGSGIASSVFAFWLLRAHPTAKITIVERDPALRLTGASVDIRSSAVDIIKWMNAEQEIRKHTTKEEGLQFVKANGKAIATFLATGRSDVQSFTSEFEIFRGRLAKIFIDLIIDRVKLIFDESVDYFEQRDDSVAVTFAKSKETKTYDLLVAADGLGSKIRGIMLNRKPHEQLYDEGVHVAYFTIKRDLLQGGRLAKWYNAPGGRVVFLRPDLDPTGRTRGNLINVTTRGDTETKARLNKALREGNDSYMKLMEDMFCDVGGVAPEVLQGMRDSDDFYCSLFGQIRSPKLRDGRVVLLGDAGYATPGFGTSLAIIGGYVLAGELLSSSGDVDAALMRYEDIMLPFVKGSQGGGDNAMQMLNPQTMWGIRIRNVILGFVSWVKLDRLVMRVASVMGFGEKKAPLPDYQWLAC
ncbi:FAD/NAD(P)-binding domain-containing protein [Lophium mytilinum]|uniref:FAD/NAD(P)-binding domain-containing protein n=1 Tax=Lophium mytilinum TaxID=390894 RepID=A0A6A6QS86_9PEZI|nr:FAD/NAD(P)-binding domain-containing protein [Lophium mytilinum]